MGELPTAARLYKYVPIYIILIHIYARLPRVTYIYLPPPDYVQWNVYFHHLHFPIVLCHSSPCSYTDIAMSSPQTATSTVLEVLVRRIEYIVCVSDEPRRKSALVDTLDAARSTADRAIDELETVNLIEQTEQGYRPTSMGRLITTDFFELIDRVDDANSDRVQSSTVPVVGIIDTATRRIEFLECLRENEKDKRTLVSDIGMSRATVDRGLRELESVGLIEYASGRFTLTPVGMILVSGLSDLIKTIELGQQLSPFLKWVSDDDFDIDLHLLADAEVLLPEPGNPWAMMNRHVKLLEKADNGWVFQPLASLHAMEAAYERIVNAGATGASVVESSVADTFRSNPNYSELVEEMISTGRFDLFVYGGTIPYYLGVFDETVQIGADDNGSPRAILESDSQPVLQWAENKYEEYRRQAELVKP
jgi:predicted transcriptional regulator